MIKVNLQRLSLLLGIVFLIPSCKVEEEKQNSYNPIEDSRFTKVILTGGLDEPTEFVILPNKDIIVVERKGGIKRYNAQTGKLRELAEIDVYHDQEDGLMGVALDPNFQSNKRIYLYYSHPEKTQQNLSMFTMKGEEIDFSTEKVILEVPTQREECCHTGGSIEFGPDGLLYLSTGDDTNPFNSDGFSPSDGRPGRAYWDARRTSGNTNDLRGKILRIRVNADGTYEIPEGNLFAPGTAKTRPEIFVMGNRNPYRISIDQKRNYLFWGEVGPDAGDNDPVKGPRGHDEINMAKKAGYFGWPLFVGDNKPYGKYNFASRRSVGFYNPEAPINDSPNNDGLQELPPAQPALIWYPYAESPEFPMVGKGGRNAMAGPVFYREDYEITPGTFPDTFNGKLFIYDWIRGWIFVVTFNDQDEIESMEPFMPNTTFNYMIDMAFGPEGSLYILEYGTGWFTKNDDAAIVKIDYNSGNRSPVLTASASETKGGAPLKVDFNTIGTFDYDSDNLFYRWEIDDQKIDSANISYTFEKPGIYYPKITVRDVAGNKVSEQFVISVGNDKPVVDIKLTGNTTFYWPNQNIDYEVMVKDKEDGSLYNEISESDVSFKIDYLKEGHDMTEANQPGHQVVHPGLRLINESDCQSCHKLNDKSIGPSYTQVSTRYKTDRNAPAFLANKIINGGGGNWGEQAMAAHPSLPLEDAEQMVSYILSIATAEASTDPLKGSYAIKTNSPLTASYIFTANYSDKPVNGMVSNDVKQQLILRSPFLQAEDFSEADKDVRISSRGNFINSIFDGAYVKYDDIDLTDIKSLSFFFVVNDESRSGGKVELRLDSKDGKLIGTMDFTETSQPFNAMMIDEVNGIHDIYFVFENKKNPAKQIYNFDWVYFSKSENPNGEAKIIY